MTQTGVFAFNSGHVRLTDNLVTRWNETGLNWIAVTHPEVATPPGNHRPQRSKGLGTMVSHDPTENPDAKVIHHRPNPNLVAFVAHKGFQFIEFPHLGDLFGVIST
jgi:hypothetical protein